MKTPLQNVIRSKGTVVHTINPEASVGTAVRSMARLNVGSVVVMNGGAVAGLLSERQVIAGLARGMDSLDRTAVRELMDTAPPLVGPDTSVGTAMSLMTERYTRHLPIVHRGELVGIVSIGDLTRWVTRSLQGEVEALHSYIVGAHQ